MRLVNSMGKQIHLSDGPEWLFALKSMHWPSIKFYQNRNKNKIFDTWLAGNSMVTSGHLKNLLLYVKGDMWLKRNLFSVGEYKLPAKDRGFPGGSVSKESTCNAGDRL